MRRPSNPGLGRSGRGGGRKGERRIDLGLALLSCLRRPGETLADEDIAAWCDCSRETIGMIAQRALRKLRRRLLETMEDEPQMRDELDAFCGRNINADAPNTL